MPHLISMRYSVETINIFFATMISGRMEEGYGSWEKLNHSKKSEGQLSARKS